MRNFNYLRDHHIRIIYYIQHTNATSTDTKTGYIIVILIQWCSQNKIITWLRIEHESNRKITTTTTTATTMAMTTAYIAKEVVRRIRPQCIELNSSARKIIPVAYGFYWCFIMQLARRVSEYEIWKCNWIVGREI